MAGAVSISELLADYMRLRGFTRRIDLARDLGVSRSMVTQWMQGMQPGLRSAQRIAAKTGLPLRLVLEAAGHTVSDLADADTRYPEWLTESLDQLRPTELAVVAETARGLLRLRAESRDGEAKE